MTAGYLLDTNHVSRAVTPRSQVRLHITELRQRGSKVGTCVPVLCEIEAGIQQVSQPDAYRDNLRRLLRQIRVWPIDLTTALLYGEIHHDLKRRGRVFVSSGHDARGACASDGSKVGDVGSGFRRGN